MVTVYLIVLSISCIVAYKWANAIEYMHIHHPDYKGEDFLNF